MSMHIVNTYRNEAEPHNHEAYRDEFEMGSHMYSKEASQQNKKGIDLYMSTSSNTGSIA
jgi:hypothetical protein